ncbi:MAG: DNA-binding protein WhiA [Christensenellales bacterium]
MNFKELVIEEILSSCPKQLCCGRAFLSAVLRTAGSVELTKKGMNCVIAVDNAGMAERVAEIIKDIYFTDVEIEKNKVKSGVKRGEDVFILKIPQGTSKEILSECGLMTMENESFSSFVRGVPQSVVKNSCCAKEYLKGLFLSSGSVYVPSTTEGGHSGYHIEYQLVDEKEADDVLELLKRFALTFKKSERGNNFLVYAKDKNLLLDFFRVLSLTETSIELEKIIADRELNNSINRNVICEAANLDKTFAAAAKQIVAIEEMDKEIGLENLPDGLKDVANARLNNPTATMSELAEILGISKSCLNHRLRKIIEMTEGENDGK